MRILVCDDVDAVRVEIRRALEAAGMEVIAVAADGLEAERLAAETEVDGIVLDLAMPGKDGVELLPVLRGLRPDARIVVLTGFAVSGIRAGLLQLGADAVCEKGCRLEELVGALEGRTMQDPSADEVQASAPGSLADEYEADRVAVARELHDGPMQLLTAVSLRLQSAVRRGEIPPEVGSRVLGQLDEAAAGLRRLMGRLLGGTRAFAEEVSTEGPDRPHGGHAPTVLVVDDEEVVRAALAEILTSRGFGVRAVASAPEALALVRRGDQPVDLVVTDLTLHGIDGAQLVTELRTIVPGLRAVCMSGYGGPARSGTGLPAGTSFLQKPFGPDELTRAVDAALGTVARPD